LVELIPAPVVRPGVFLLYGRIGQDKSKVKTQKSKESGNVDPVFAGSFAFCVLTFAFPDYAAFSQLIIHGVPKRSISMPNRKAQKVSPNGICTCPPSASALKMRSARAGSSI
jgi:hypothetical protein